MGEYEEGEILGDGHSRWGFNLRCDGWNLWIWVGDISEYLLNVFIVDTSGLLDFYGFLWELSCFFFQMV